MAMDEKLSATVRAALADAEAVREVKMFGGLGFMLNGNMIAATSDRGLLVRVGAQGQAEALRDRAAQLMEMNGRVMTGYVRFTGTLDADDVGRWIRLARAFVETLPSKAAKAKSDPSKKPKSKAAKTTPTETAPGKRKTQVRVKRPSS